MSAPSPVGKVSARSAETAAKGDESFVRLGPIRVRVNIRGEGAPLLLINGIGGNLDMWEPLAARLTGRQLIMFDFPGTGGSGASWLPPTMAHNALIVRGMLWRLGYRSKVDVLGYSWGGVLAQHLAIQHPWVVDHLILAATTPGWGGRFPAVRVSSKMITPRRYYSGPYFAKVAPTIYGGRFRTNPELVHAEIAVRLGRPPSIPGYAAQLAAAMSYSSLPAIRLIRSPTLILAGDDDPLIPTFNPKLMKAGIAHATLRILPGSGHLVLLDSPELVGPIIEEFLASGRP